MIKSETLDQGATNHIRRLVNTGNVQDLLVDSDKIPTSLRAALRTANVLTCLSYGIETVTEIAEICKLNKATVHGLLQVLCEARLVMMDPINHRYFVGPLITEIASNPLVTHEYLISCALNDMVSLSVLSGETIYLAILIGLQSITLHEIPGTYEFKIVVGKSRINDKLHAGATGKILLSQLSSRQLKIALANLKMDPITEYTVTRKDQLIAQIKQIQDQDYGVSFGEGFVGAMNISVPIKNYVLPVSVNILGPENRIKPKMNEYIQALKSAGLHIQENLDKTFKLMK
jgi:IclR family KDG regulon transcriptional repressor